MKKQTIQAFVLTLALSTTGFVEHRLWAEDFTVASGQTRVVNSLVTLSTEQFDNLGILQVSGTGELKIGTGVTNLTSLGEDISGLNLGLVQVAGNIDAELDIRFHQGSTITGEVTSTKAVVFDGGSTISGSIHAESVVFSGWPLNAADDTEATTTYVDLSGGAELDVKTILVNGIVEITTADDGAGGTEKFVVDNLILGVSGSKLTVSGDLEVTGNYTGYASTTIFCEPDGYDGGAGTIILRGGGAAVDGVNNYIEQTKIYAANLQVEKSTLFVNTFSSYGDVTVAGVGSTARAKKGLSIDGKLVVEEGATLQLDGSSTDNMFYSSYTYKYFNGAFYDGFTLQNGATLKATTDAESLALSIGNTSYIGEQSDAPVPSLALLKGRHMTITGVDSVGKMALQSLYNRGEIVTSGTLELNAVELTVTGSGTLETNALKLANSSVLTLHASDSLSFVGTTPTVSIGTSSKIDATGRQLDFTGVAVTNANTSGGIVAQSLVFGSGGSLAGAGKTLANTAFGSGSTAILTSAGNMDFGDKEVRFADGSTIQLTINSTVGMVKTTGKVATEGTLTLKITDTSVYSGRTKTFEIIQGGEGSTFNAELVLANSLFFTLSDWGSATGKENSLLVEIVKVADLVDFASSHNQRNLANMIDIYLNNGGAHEVQESLFGGVMGSSTDSSYRHALDSVSGVSRENAVLFALSSPWRIPLDNIGFKRLPLRMNDGSRLARSDSNDIFLGQVRKFSPTWKKEEPKVAAVPSRKQTATRKTGYGTPHDLWFDTFYHYSKIDSDGNAPGGEGHRGGFYGGFGLPSPSQESVVGLSVGYTTSRYKQWADKTDISDVQVGLYGGTNLLNRNLQLRAYIGFGFQDYSMERNVQLDGYLPLPVSGDTEGMSLAAALYLLRPVDVSERLMIKGLFGIDTETIRQDGFTETGTAAALLRYDKVSLSRTMLRFGLLSNYAFERSDLYGRFLLGVKVAGDETAYSLHRFVYTPGSEFGIDSVNLKSVAVDVGFGGNFALNQQRTTSLFVDYNTNFTSNTNSHAVSLGFLWQR